MIVILPKRVSLLADQLSKILLIFSIFSIEVELREATDTLANTSMATFLNIASLLIDFHRFNFQSVTENTSNTKKLHFGAKILGGGGHKCCCDVKIGRLSNNDGGGYCYENVT